MMSGRDIITARQPRVLRNWRIDERGSVAIYVALIAALLFGIVGLAIDASRAMALNSEAQAAADAAALAAASQLDGTPTAITRANTALTNLVANNQRLASTGASAVAIANVRYLKDLPADDAQPITAAFETTDPLEARFVEVTTAPLTHLNTFLRAVGATAPLNIARTSVAGCNQIVCRSQPLMICNPAEQGNIGANFDIDTWRGRQVRMVYQAPGSQLQPGNFGYLDPGQNGANALREALASTSGGNVCYGLTAATSPGLSAGARTALNVRFGIYENPGFGGGARNNPLYAPDVNVRAMPRDQVFSGPGSRFGNGRWNCQTYWTNNFASSGVAKPSACADNSSAYSRYEMYQYEIANNLSQAPTQNAANKIAGRRIIYVAVVNCLENSFNGRDPAVPVTTYLRVLLTEPVSDPSGFEVVGEIVDVVQLGQDDGVLYDNVQLYR